MTCGKCNDIAHHDDMIMSQYFHVHHHHNDEYFQHTPLALPPNRGAVFRLFRIGHRRVQSVCDGSLKLG